MSTSELSNLAPLPTPPSPAPSAGGPPGGGWLGSQSVFDQGQKRRFGTPMILSLAFHGLILLGLIWAGVQHAVEAAKEEKMKFDVVFLQQKGPGGGGGGSPAPAPPKKLAIPPPKAAEPVPVPAVVPPPPPMLNAPVMTNPADILQASGSSLASLAPVGGGGSGGGIGPGRGNGLGPGSGGGTGGGVYQPGNGVSTPTILRSVDPQYTSEAMRAKVQGIVVLDAVVQPNGLLTAISVVRSLDKQYGLDLAAIEAAKKWLFAPGKKDGVAVPVQVRLELEFRLH